MSEEIENDSLDSQFTQRRLLLKNSEKKELVLCNL